MWALYYKATKYNKLPSEYFADLVDEWTRYCFDNAVTYFGSVIEGALTETVEQGMGNNKRSVAKYTLRQLLDPVFRLPRPPQEPRAAHPQGGSGLAALLALAGQPNSGVKQWAYVPPVELVQ